MKRKANATWFGTLKEGRGELGTESGALAQTPYSFATRFEDGVGTNPEELIGAAHAGCFSMALSGLLMKEGIEPARIDTEATVILEKTDEGFTITEVHLTTRIEAPGADAEKVEAAAKAAETGCPVSRVLNATIRLETTLVQ